jgi:hypothetical protein
MITIFVFEKNKYSFMFFCKTILISGLQYCVDVNVNKNLTIINKMTHLALEILNSQVVVQLQLWWSMQGALGIQYW